MIPHRMFPGEFSNSGVKDRVTACRKRLRENRVLLRTPASSNIEAVFSGGTNAMASPVRGNNCQFDVDGVQDEALEMIAEQEVGIT